MSGANKKRNGPSKWNWWVDPQKTEGRRRPDLQKSLQERESEALPLVLSQDELELRTTSSEISMGSTDTETVKDTARIPSDPTGHHLRLASYSNYSLQDLVCQSPNKFNFHSTVAAKFLELQRWLSGEEH